MWCLLALFAVGTGGMLLFIFESLHPPRYALKVSPASQGIAFENIHFPSADGTNLAGWWIPAPNAPATVILCHGYPANRSDVVPVIPFIHHAGYNVLAFDFRRLGASGGDMSTIGLLEPGDLHGAVDYAGTRSKAPVAVVGYSMGAAVAVMTAATDTRIHAVVADSPYVSLDIQATRRLKDFVGVFGKPVGWCASWLGGMIVGRPLASASPLKSVAKVTCPVFFIHGMDDHTIPYHDSELVYAAANQPKELWLVPGADHISSFSTHRAQYEQKVLAFLHTALRH